MPSLSNPSSPSAHVRSRALISRGSACSRVFAIVLGAASVSVCSATFAAVNTAAAKSVELATAQTLVGSANQSRDEHAYTQHLMLLADPFMEGRGPGTNGNNVAADYLKFHFERLGLKPAFVPEQAEGDQTAAESSAGPEAPAEQVAASFYQKFQAGREARASEAQVLLNPSDSSARSFAFAYGTDYSVMGFSADADLKDAELVFVGYALESAGKDGVEYSSFDDDDDLTGKVAVMLRFEPMDEQGRSLWRNEATGSGAAGWSGSSGLAGKLQAVIQRNAAGVIVINTPGAADERVNKLETTVGSASWSRRLDVPVLMMSPDAGERLVRAATASAEDAKGTSLMDLRRKADRIGLPEADGGTKSGAIALTGAKLSVNVKVERVPRNTWNVAGVLPGFGSLVEEYVIIGAHYDHVGYGYTGGSRMNEMGVIHPGADDNASGTSGLLLAADLLCREYAAMRERWNTGFAGDQGDPRTGGARSIIFVGFSAEEMGLIGSREFVKAAPVEASKITCMINMDMIGRYGSTIGSESGGEAASEGSAGGHAGGSSDAGAKSSQPEVSRRGVINSGAGLELGGVGTAEGWREIVQAAFEPTGLRLKYSPGGRGPSDHASFYAASIPVLFVFTGLHEEYHTPRDTADLINVPGAVQVTYGVTRAALAAATRPEILKFTSTDKSRSNDHAGPGDQSQVSMRSVKVRFGIAPGNYAEGELGVLVGEVYPNTSAAIAGIKAGDRLLKWNGQEIGDVAAWMTQLSQHKPGDVVDVTLQRKDGTSEVVPVTLKAREQMDQ